MADLAFILIVSGLLLILGEFIWVGKLIFLITGSLCALAGLSMLSRFSFNPEGAFCLAFSAICFFLEAAFQTQWIAGILGSISLGYGSWLLVDGSAGVSPWVAFPLSVAYGLLTTRLMSAAKRARRNKRCL